MKTFHSNYLNKSRVTRCLICGGKLVIIRDSSCYCLDCKQDHYFDRYDEDKLKIFDLKKLQKEMEDK